MKQEDTKDKDSETGPNTTKNKQKQFFSSNISDKGQIIINRKRDSKFNLVKKKTDSQLMLDGLR